jgi:leucyl aminopeptidase
LVLIVRNPKDGRAPGADDDGSGSMTLLEAYRALMLSRTFHPDRPVEFHWYSAEEVGLRGSFPIAESYYEAGRVVAGMMQLDMTGTPKNSSSPVMGVITDYTDRELNVFLKNVAIKTYGGDDFVAVDTLCGYACSDHAAWNRFAYPSVFVFEDSFKNANPHVHTPQDDLSNIDFNHMMRFARTAVAFAIELSLVDQN